jgi:hypothetical protein
LGVRFVNLIWTPLVGQAQAFRQSLENDAKDDLDKELMWEGSGAIRLLKRVPNGRCGQHE